MKTALRNITGTQRAGNGLLVVLAAVLAVGCNSVYMNFDYDDVYGRAPSQAQERQALAQASRTRNNVQQATTEPAYYYDEETGEYYTYGDDTASYEYPAFNYDNYYDYEYSSRLRRFHQDDYITDNYYDDYYTNTYLYDHNPDSYGTSIYLGFNNWMPSIGIYGGGWSLSYGYGYDPFWYRPYRYWPSYSYYWDWGWPGYWGPSYYGGGYWGGWNNGYWNGYWDGYHDAYYWGNGWACNDYFYNSHDPNTYYKQEIRRGHNGAGSGSGTQPLAVQRGGSGGGSGAVSGHATASNNNSVRRGANGGVASSFGERYQAAVQQERVSGQNNHRTGGSVNTTNPVRPTQTQTRVQTNSGAQRYGSGTATPTQQRSTTTTTQPQRTSSPQRGVNTTNPVRPTQTQVQTNGGTQRYNATPTQQRTTTTTTQPQRTTAPQNSGRPNVYTAPAYNNGVRNGASYASPQSQRQTTPSYSRPTQATPARQSAPAVRSAATPTRTSTPAVRSTSSGSSGGSRSSGGSSGGNSGGGSTRRR